MLCYILRGQVSSCPSFVENVLHVLVSRVGKPSADQLHIASAPAAACLVRSLSMLGRLPICVIAVVLRGEVLFGALPNRFAHKIGDMCWCPGPFRRDRVDDVEGGSWFRACASLAPYYETFNDQGREEIE